MSAAWGKGSSRAWRRLRLIVLERDRWTCQVDGCHAIATTVGHLDPLCEGNPKLARLDRLRAECARHNYSEGAKLGNARARARRPSWSW